MFPECSFDVIVQEKNEAAGYYIRSGIITILRNAVIADGTVI
jgi:hypothetical protein